MRIKQEQIVFLLSVLAVGGLSFKLFSGTTTRASRRSSGDEQELARHQPPVVERSLSDERTLLLQRGYFSPPRDTYPLPPLGLIEPPREELVRLLPPTSPGPEPAAYGKLLRRELPLVDLPDLFEAVDVLADSALDEDPFFTNAGETSAPAAGGLGNLSAAISGSSGLDTSGMAAADLTPAERAAQLEGFRGRYDWILAQSGLHRFGRIENVNRYELLSDELRANEELRFVEVDPRTGRELLGNINDGSVNVARESAVQWGFAETFANDLEVRQLRIGETLTRGSFALAMDLGNECVRRWLEAPRALEVAEKLFRRAAAFDAKDPAPELGLARCYEAAFNFEAAFQTYQDLLTKFDHRAEVHSRLGALEARWLATDSAEKRMRHAVEIDRSSWESRWTLGRFLLDRGRGTEALEHLEAANRSAPTDPSRLHERVAIRADLGTAYLAVADLAQARRSFDQALNADKASQRARAGRIAVDLLSGDAANGSASLDNDVDGAGFELLLARGVAALAGGDHAAARDQLLLAADVDPLRASGAYAALSYLAEITGNHEQASSYAADALGADPGNAYALFQKGRLLGLSDDFNGARDALTAALEVELDFEEALVALGDMAFRLGRFEDAERYLERAVSLDETRADIHSLRGMNFLRLERIPSALASFDASLELDRNYMPARAGRSWCVYLDGESTEAMVLLGQMVDNLRSAPEGDPMKVWATAQIDRITDHQQKEAWSDRFERKKLINDWNTREAFGPVVGMLDGAVRIEGVHNTSGTTLAWREYPSSLFVSLEADIWIEPSSNVRAGIFISRERSRRNQEPEVISEGSISRHRDGALQVRVQKNGTEPILTDMAQPFPTGKWARLRIERTGESGSSRLSFSLDGIPLVEGAPMPGIGRASTPLLVGLFAEGEPGRKIDVRMDNVEVVYRR